MNERIPNCDECAKTFWPMLRKRLGLDEDGIPCFKCKMPELWEENLLSWKVFTVAASQMRVVAMGTPLGLEFSAIDRACEYVGVPDTERRTVWNRVRRAGEAYAAQIRKAQDQKRRQEELKSKRTSTSKGGPDLPPMYV